MKYSIETDTTLLKALNILSPDSSQNTLRSWVKQGRVTIDGLLIERSNQQVFKGQLIEVGTRKRFLPHEVEILYEDRDLVVINKPSGLLSVDLDNAEELSAHKILKNHYSEKNIRVYIVHRLDRDTSGLMIFALSKMGLTSLKDLLAKHQIKRVYTAIVEGFLEPRKGTWSSYLYEDVNFIMHSTQNPARGKRAITHYKVVKKTKKYSLLEVQLETGKKNQIRVHCSEAGHPIVGDSKYGAKSNHAKRLCLHAIALHFYHPVTNKPLRFSSPTPKALENLISPSQTKQ